MLVHTCWSSSLNLLLSVCLIATGWFENLGFKSSRPCAWRRLTWNQLACAHALLAAGSDSIALPRVPWKNFYVFPTAHGWGAHWAGQRTGASLAILVVCKSDAAPVWVPVYSKNWCQNLCHNSSVNLIDWFSAKRWTIGVTHPSRDPNFRILNYGTHCSVSDPHRSYADPDPTCRI
jgi:hypothetical protein